MKNAALPLHSKFLPPFCHLCSTLYSLSLSYKVILLSKVVCDRCFSMQSTHACLNIIKKQKTFQVTRVSSSML